MLVILAAFAAVLLGAKGFTEEGIPLTHQSNITGAPAKVIGVVCILLSIMLCIGIVVFQFLAATSIPRG